jgi:hypothetical protein
MPASYPTSVKTFTTKVTSQTIEASHINEPQDEITAIETGLLQGLAHHLFPDTDVTRDLGTATKRWRDALIQRLVAGVTAATKFRVQEAGDSTWLTVNASFDGTNWNRDDTAAAAQAIEITATKEVKYYRAAAGANPITWANIFTVSTDKITASQAVIGTDPGGTETLRAQTFRAGATALASLIVGADPGGTEVLRAHNLRAGATTLTAGLTAPSAVVGTDPGGEEVLRAQNLRAGAATFTEQITSTVATGTAPITVASTTVAPNLNADMVDGQHLADLDTRYVNTTGDGMTGALVVGTDPGGTEVLRAQNLRAGATTLTAGLAAPSVVVGTDPGGSEVLRAQNLRAGATTLTAGLSAPSAVVGAAPDGSEVLRAQNLRAGTTTFTGTVTLAADPTDALQAATKQYVDTSGLIITDKTGSGTGDYSTTSSSYVDMDANNLAYTVVIPSGKKVVILATGTWAFTSSIANPVVAGVAIAEDTTTIVEGLITLPGPQERPFVLSTVVTGTGASKTYKLRFRSSGGLTFIIRNGSAPIAPRLTFIGA